MNRIYCIKVMWSKPTGGHGGEDASESRYHLVEAQSSTQAIRYVASKMMLVTLALPKDIISLTKSGVELENATKEN